MKEITRKDLNMGLLGKRTKAGLIDMICHVANIANEYTSPGDTLMGDRVLSKLNLTRPRFKIRRKPLPEVPKPPAWEPKVGENVKIVEGSTYWAPGKVGAVLSRMSEGWEVQVRFADSFNGETEARDHVICASKVEPFLPEKKDEANPS